MVSAEQEIKTFVNNHKGWYHFSFKSGSNPYIATSDAEKVRMLKKYNGKIIDIDTTHMMFVIDDIEKREVF